MAKDVEEKRPQVEQAQPDINVTPLIDVLLVLLIIFMVITPLKPHKIESKVPERAQAGTEVVNPLVIVLGVQVDAQGRVTSVKINQEPTSMENLGARLKEILDPLPSDRKTIFISAARNAIYGEIVKIIDIAKAAGASPIGLQIDDLPES
ncbi:MAG: biopolymer transporter ExbD [Acidobacteria bacterium]|nr:biopolymer transporter ExbD [Acidobacteriota bacterium]